MAMPNRRSWLWQYFTENSDKAWCIICNQFYHLKKIYFMKKHMESIHNDVFKSIMSSTDSHENVEWPVSEIQNTKVQCGLCRQFLPIYMHYSSYMKDHLEKIHQLNKDLVKDLCFWLSNYYHFDKTNKEQKCIKCGNSFINKCLILIEHVEDCHQVTIPQKFEPMRFRNKSSNLSNSNRNDDIATVSSFQQPNSNQQLSFSFDDISFDSDTFDDIDYNDFDNPDNFDNLRTDESFFSKQEK